MIQMWGIKGTKEAASQTAFEDAKMSEIRMHPPDRPVYEALKTASFSDMIKTKICSKLEFIRFS